MGDRSQGRSRKAGEATVKTGPPAGKNQVTRFVVLFLFVLLVLALAYPVALSQFRDAGSDMCVLTARMVETVAAATSDGIRRQDNRVSYRDFTIEVVGECTGLFEIVIFAAAVIAFPTNTRRKVVGIVAGAAVILIANQIRMVTLLWIGASSLYWFSIFHFYTYQLSMLLIVIGTWMLWLYGVVFRRKERNLPVSH